eukprot:5372602-Prymnesium_polylepis.1
MAVHRGHHHRMHRHVGFKGYKQAIKSLGLVVAYHLLAVLVYGGREWKQCIDDSPMASDPLNWQHELNMTAGRWMLSPYPGKHDGSECWTTWSTIDALYFAMVTMSTVGYGDLAPTSESSRLVTIVFILVGVFAVFLQISHVALVIEGMIENDSKRVMEKVRRLPVAGIATHRWSCAGDGGGTGGGGGGAAPGSRVHPCVSLGT